MYVLKQCKEEKAHVRHQQDISANGVRHFREADEASTFRTQVDGGLDFALLRTNSPHTTYFYVLYGGFV